MSKSFLFSVILMTQSAFSQVDSGTIIVVHFTPDRLIIAADSRGIDTDTGKPNDFECKIAQFSHRLIFTTVGDARRTKTFKNDPVPSWDNWETTRLVFQQVKDTSPENGQLRELSKRWVDAVADKWRLFYRSYPNNMRNLVPESGEITTGYFATAGNGTLFFEGGRVAFDKSLSDPITIETGDDMGDCWECGEANKVCAAGKHLEVVAKSCSERKPGQKISIRTKLKHANEDTRVTGKIAESVLDAYTSTVGDVGGKVDVITLRSNGKIVWNVRKPSCLQNQD